VRRATHQDDRERREREVDGGVLGDDGEPARNLAPSVGREGSPREPDGARARREDPRQEPDERRLAASVRTDHAEDLPGQEREADRAENLARAVAERDRVRLEERGHPSARRRSRCRRERKKGPPVSAVTTPTGSSAGPSIVRASVSAQVRKAPPPRNEAGRRRRWSGPSRRRSRWGTIKPTKPIMPLIDTAAPTSSDAATNTARRARSTSTPSWRAPSSPAARRFKSSACRRSQARPATAYAAAAATRV